MKNKKLSDYEATATGTENFIRENFQIMKDWISDYIIKNQPLDSLRLYEVVDKEFDFRGSRGICRACCGMKRNGYFIGQSFDYKWRAIKIDS